MKTITGIASLLLTILYVESTQAQSTTGGRSGGSTASTGTGYLTEGKRPAETSAASMTIADEGASRDYMYVPSTKATTRSVAVDRSTNLSSSHQRVLLNKSERGPNQSLKKRSAQQGNKSHGN